METLPSLEGIGDGVDPTAPPINSSSQTMTPMSIPTFDELTNKQVILIIVFGLISLVTISANLFVLYIFAVGKRRLRNPTNLLLANLAVADLLVGLVVMPLLASTTILDGIWLYGDLACESFDYIHFLLCGASMWSMIGVGVDRYIGVTHPLQYKNIITRNRTIIVIILIWIAAACLTSGPLTYWPKIMSGIPTICFVNLGKHFLLFVVFFAYWLPISGTVIIYFLVYRNAITPFTQKSAAGRTPKPGAGKSEVTGAKSKQTRLAKSIAIVTGALFIFYAPVFLVFTIKAFDLPYFSVDLLFLTAWIRYCCSTVNPFMYGLAVPGYRQEIKERLFGISGGGNRLEDSLTQSYVTGSDQGQLRNGKNVEEKPQSVEERSAGPRQTIKRSRYCTQCGFLMNDVGANKNFRCDKCHRQVQCASWILPSTWGTPSYFTCPDCPTIRFFDGIEPCFCQNCSHKFAPLDSQRPQERIASLTTVAHKPPQQIVKDTTPSNSNHCSLRVVGQGNELKVPDQKAKVIERLRNSVIVPYLEQRRSHLTVTPGQGNEAGGNNGAINGNTTNSISLKELDEIMAQLEQTFGLNLNEPA